MRLIIIFLISFCFLATPVAAGEIKEIELRDGGMVLGEIIKLEGDFYTIKSLDLGTVRIEKSKVRAICPKSADETRREQLKALEQRMMNDDEILAILLTLESDPLFKEILEDPEIMKGVSPGDITNLMSNPKLLKLLDNPKVQKIRKKIQE
jgi:hypothetical protein